MARAVHLFTDADNTLWDTNAVYARAQLALLRDIESATGFAAPEAEDRGLEFLRRVDQRIAASHPDRLRYPPVMLARGLRFALEGAEPERAAALATASDVAIPEFGDVVARFVEHLRAVPGLRTGVLEGLKGAREAGIGITVVTEDRPERCEALLGEHGLSAFVTDIVSVSKTTDAFRRLREGHAARRVLMVGDQLDRDIRPAEEAGFEAFYFPSEFRPYWLGDIRPIRAREIARFDEIIPYLRHDPTSRVRMRILL